MRTETTAHLRQEHEEIRRKLRGFCDYLRAIKSGEAEGSSEAAGFIDFFGEALLQKHEEKEEDIILPQVARMGLRWNDGTVAHVRKDHRHGRDLFRTLRQSLNPRKQWSSFERTHFLSIARAWVEFVEEHMVREERLLFPFIDANLSSDEDALIVRQLEKTDLEYQDMGDSSCLASSDAFLESFSSDPERSQG